MSHWTDYERFLFNPDPPSPDEDHALKVGWEAGSIIHLHEAFLRYSCNSLPLPMWVIEGVDTVMEEAFAKGGSTGQGSGGYAMRTSSVLTDEMRHLVASQQLDLRGTEGGPKNRGEAFEQASTELAGTEFQGSKGMIERSHDRIARRQRKL